jgi:membrane-associated phospholipid phosphatase
VETWTTVTDFGDSAITLPIAAVVLTFLILTNESKLAIAWVIGVFGCATFIGGMKLIIGICEAAFAGAGVRSPSGHAAMATAVYGGCAVVIGPSLRRWARIAMTHSVIILVVAILISRLALRRHTLIEVSVGLAVGLGGLLVISSAEPRRPKALPVLWLIGAALPLLLIFYGAHWPVERAIQVFGTWLYAWRPGLCR